MSISPRSSDRPFFASTERLDQNQSMASANFARGNMSIAQFRRDRPGLGVTDSNPAMPVLMAVVMLRSLAGHGGWRGGRRVDIPDLDPGSLACVDLRESWVSDLPHPFHTFHAFIPLTVFDEFSSEMKLPKIETLSCPMTVQTHDETMLGIANALGPLMAKPSEANNLFTDHMFSAMVAHLASRYGGLTSRDVRASEGRRCGALTSSQQRLVTDFILEDLTSNPGLSDLASFCGLSRSHFARAFKRTMGMPPHRWLMTQRINRSKDLLCKTRMPIIEIAMECGFADQAHLTRVFTRAFGIGPGGFRRHRQE